MVSYDKCFKKSNKSIRRSRSNTKEVDNAKDLLAKAIAELQINSSISMNTEKIVSTVKSGNPTASVKTGATISLIYPLVELAAASIVFYENKKRRGIR